MQTIIISDIHIGTNYKTCWYQKSVHEPYMIALLDHIIGCCQTNANQSLQGQCGCPLCRAETAPFGESGGTVQLEEVST